MRSTRNQPFCWQEKKVLRLLRANFKGADLAKLRNLYLTITEIDSDFNNEDIKYFTKTIASYSGLSQEWIPTGLKIFEKLKMIEIVEEREKGKFKGKKIVFTPENIDEMGISTITVKSLNGKSSSGFSESSEDILYQEDILYKKNHDKKIKTVLDKTLDVFENLFKEFGINFTKTNQASVKVLLKTMSEKEVIEYLRETYTALKENKSIKSIARAFTAKIQKGERQINSKPKVEKTNNPIISTEEKRLSRKEKINYIKTILSDEKLEKLMEEAKQTLITTGISLSENNTLLTEYESLLMSEYNKMNRKKEKKE